jgi:hypothetical protein
MENLIQVEKIGPYKISIFQDTDTYNPLGEFDHVGEFALYDGRHLVSTNKKGSPYSDITAQREWIISHRNDIFLLYAVTSYEQDGRTFGTLAEKMTKEYLEGFLWDASGFYYITKGEAKTEWPEWTKYPGKEKRLSRREMAKLNMEGTIQTLSDFYEGNVYGFVVERKGVEMEEGSLWGRYGLDYCLSEAKALVLSDAMRRMTEKLGAKREFWQDPKTEKCWHSFKL